MTLRDPVLSPFFVLDYKMFDLVLLLSQVVPCVSRPVRMMKKSDFPLGTPLTDFHFTLAHKARDKIPYVSRGAGKIFMSAAPLWMDYMA